MSSLRHFLSKLPDFGGDPISVPKDRIRKQCINLLKQIEENEKSILAFSEGDLYVGTAGIAYAFYYISQHPEFTTEKCLKGLDLKYLDHALNHRDQKKRKSANRMASFLCDNAGIYAVGAAISRSHNKEADDCSHFVEKYIELADVCSEVDFLEGGSDEILVGRAGYLSGALFLQKTFGHPVVPEKKIFKVLDAAIKSGVNYSRQVRSLSPLMYQYHGTEYLGAAHGVSGILQMMLCFPSYLDGKPDAERLVKDSVDFMLSLQTPTGNFPTGTDEVRRARPPEKELVHWCHGAAGVVYLMAKAYMRWKEDKYLQSCLACGELTWQKGLLKKGPGICHGVAGSGYVFLLLYRLTKNEKYLHRAIQFAEFMTTDEFTKAREPDRPFSLYEGTAGTALFLADLMCPEKAHFPFFDVF